MMATAPRTGTFYRKGDVRYAALGKHITTADAICYVAIRHPDGEGYVVLSYFGALEGDRFEEDEIATEVLEDGFSSTVKAAADVCDRQFYHDNGPARYHDLPDEWVSVPDCWRYIKHLDL